MRIDFDAAVTDSDGGALGRLSGVVFERESRRVAGFLVVTGGAAPRDVFVKAGQAAQIEQGRIALAVSGDDFAGLPDARQRLYVMPGQDVEEEIAAAEAEGEVPDTPDPDEEPAHSAIPGVALTPGMMIPLEVERTAFDEGQVPLEAGLRVVAADGEELGWSRGVVVDEAQLVGLVVGAGDDELVIPHDRLDQLDTGADELRLTVERGTLDAPAGEGRDGGERAGQAGAGA